MSAWDIAGAVLWTPLAALHWYLLPQIRKDAKPIRRIEFIAVTVMLSAVAVFCVARLFGAHA